MSDLQTKAFYTATLLLGDSKSFIRLPLDEVQAITTLQSEGEAVDPLTSNSGDLFPYVKLHFDAIVACTGAHLLSIQRGVFYDPEENAAPQSLDLDFEHEGRVILVDSDDRTDQIKIPFMEPNFDINGYFTDVVNTADMLSSAGYRYPDNPVAINQKTQRRGVR